MGRVPCCEKDKVKRGQWTPEEDNKLSSYISQHGTRNWRLIPKNAGLQRCGKSCRLRWTNYLRPDLKHGQFSPAEEETIMKLHAVVGNRWSLIAAQLPGRTDNDVKNHWNTKLKKKLTGMGIDPVTHKSFSHLMTEIATTLGPPQVANLTEAALGCFKDEMLHLPHKKRIDSQLLPVPFNNTIASTDTTAITTVDTTYPHPTNNHLNINNNRDNNNFIKMSRKADDQKGTKHSDTHDDHHDTVEKIKIGLSRAIRHCPPAYHHDILISNNNSNDESNIMRPCWETITQEQANAFTEFQYGQSSFGHNNNEDEDEENDGSPWSQSMCTGSNSTEGGDRAVGYLKLDQQGHENNITTIDRDGDDSQGIRIRNESGGIFSSDCVIWIYHLMNW